MNELLSGDFYIPEFALMLPPHAETEGYELVEVDNFMKNNEGLSEWFDAQEMVD